MSDSPSDDLVETEDLVALTDGPWRFFLDESEASAIYNIQFEPDGTCLVPGDDVVYACEYVQSGPAIDITLHKNWDPGQAECPALFDTSSWFRMTRVGNTLDGVWEVQGLSYGCADGLEDGGIRVNGPDFFARPERPEDPG